jgi:type IV pilus assembly protein PilV
VIRAPYPARGFTLLEVLIALVIISVGLLGIAALQVKAQQAEMESYQRSQALILVADMANRIDANRGAAGCYTTAGSFIGTGADPAECTAFGVAETQALASGDLRAWAAALRGATETLDGSAAGGVIGGRGCIVPDSSNTVFIISVAWQGSHSLSAPDNPCAAGQFGADDGLRRVVSTTVRLADLNG